MSLMSDVTHQVKHPPTCTIHSPFTRENTKCFFFFKCVQILKSTLCIYVFQAVVHLVVKVWREEGLQTDSSAGNVVESCMHDNEERREAGAFHCSMFNFTLRSCSPSSLVCL